MEWKKMPDGKEKYCAYLCSREWKLKVNKIKVRSKGNCERCKKNKSSQVHHLTYIRIYKEKLTDLQDLCEGCHKYVSGKSNIDPLNKRIQ
jgi:hypothetical protein